MLLDTSGLLALYDQGFHGHASAVEYFQLTPQRLTHNYILAEFVALVTARGFMRAPAFQFLQEIVQQVEVVWVDTNLHTQAFAYLTARQDKQYSLCDAVSFVLMEQRGVTDALTTDRHFAQAGFVKLLQA